VVYTQSMAHIDSWLSGFIDGEGCFIIYVSRSGKVAQCRFVVQVRDDDLAALRLAQATLGGAGSIRVHDSPSSKSRPLARWSLSSKSDCARLVRHLDQFPLLAKKRRDYEIWKRAVASLAEKRDVALLAGLRDELRAARSYV